MVSRKEKLRVIDRAIETLREDGWCREEYVCDEGSVCALGAIGFREGFSTSAVKYAVANDLDILLTPEMDSPTDGVVEWNDSAFRTKRQVVGAFQRLRSKLVKLMENR